MAITDRPHATHPGNAPATRSTSDDSGTPRNDRRKHGRRLDAPETGWPAGAPQSLTPSSPRPTALGSGVLDVLSLRLDSTGQWAAWRALDERLASFTSLAHAAESWQHDRGNCPYAIVAALTALGSSRGQDDDDAALCVVVLLSDGIRTLARDLRDVCQPDDVTTAVWVEVKRAEARPGDRAARHLLHRARQRLLRPRTGFVAAQRGSSSLEAWMERPSRDGIARRELPAPDDEDPAEELNDLLTWAHTRGLVEERDLNLLRDLVVACHFTDEHRTAMSIVGRRYGLTVRSVRSRRDIVVARLRQAVPEYVAATA